MELFTLGFDHYTEHRIREAARAFTSWNYNDLTFVINIGEHDDATKTVLGKGGNFSGEDIVDILVAQPADEFIAAKVYCYFVRDEPSEGVTMKLAAVLRSNGYEIAPHMETIFLSQDFYSADSIGSAIKRPVQLATRFYRKIGLDRIPGFPDFNSATGVLGQHPFSPPTVAGWAQGCAWITPALLISRKNFASDVIFPDINPIPNDRYPDDARIRAVSKRLADSAREGQANFQCALPVRPRAQATQHSALIGLACC